MPQAELSTEDQALSCLASAARYKQLDTSSSATHVSYIGQACEAQHAGAHLAPSSMNCSAGLESHGYGSQLQQGATTVQTGYPPAPKGGLPTGLPSLQTNSSHEALQVRVCADSFIPPDAFMLIPLWCPLRICLVNSGQTLLCLLLYSIRATAPRLLCRQHAASLNKTKRNERK